MGCVGTTYGLEPVFTINQLDEKQETVPSAGLFSFANIPTINLPVSSADGKKMAKQPNQAQPKQAHRQWTGTGWHHYEIKQESLQCAVGCEGCDEEENTKTGPPLPFEDLTTPKRPNNTRERKKKLKRLKHLG